MGSHPGQASPRPLTRSLEPLADESLAGYLLRLSCRLRISPLQLARLTGCSSDSSAAIGRHLLLDLDVQPFAQATRLTADEASSLTLISWADRYPPIARSRTGQGTPAVLDDWLFSTRSRYCPDCLAGDDSPVQQQFGGPWKKAWLLPIAFACPQHRRFLREGCPQPHPASPGAPLIAFPSGGALHPAQCRMPQQPGKTGRHRLSCGTRLDQPGDDDLLLPSPGTLDAQQGLLAQLGQQHPAGDAARAFTDLRVITALLCLSWPLGQDLVDPRLAAAAGEHVRQLSIGSRRALDRQPGSALATAGLLTAAIAVLDSPDLAGTVARHVQARKPPGSPSKSSWARVLDRHHSACSPALREAAEPATRAYRRSTGPHSPKAPARVGGYRPEHIPALLEQHWYDEHLACLGYRAPVNMRRAGSVLLVQWASGGSMGDAAGYLGIRLRAAQHSFAPDLARWLRENGSGDFTAAMRSLAAQLDAAPGLVNYQRRRQAMQEWSLDPGTWRDLTGQLPLVPGPVQPVLDDRKRQEASAFTWACVTQGEPRFAPRPIEAMQPEQVRRVWIARRASVWWQLTRPDPLNHYAALRKLLIKHARHLASRIDSSAPGIPLSRPDNEADHRRTREGH
jgi:TniQ